MDSHQVNLNFYPYNEEEEKVNITSNFNIYCSYDLIKELKLNENDNVVVCHINSSNSCEGKKSYVCCCIKSLSEMDMKKKTKRNDVYTNTFVFKSLNIDISNEGKWEDGIKYGNEKNDNRMEKKSNKWTKKKHYSIRVEIRKAELYTPIQRIKFSVQEMYNEPYENLKDYYYNEHNSYMLQTFWNNLKSKNMEKYINLSLLNTCLFPENSLKICVLGIHTHLVVSDVVLQIKKNQNWDKVPFDNMFRIPYVNHNTKIVIERIKHIQTKHVRNGSSCTNIMNDSRESINISDSNARGYKKKDKCINSAKNDETGRNDSHELIKEMQKDNTPEGSNFCKKTQKIKDKNYLKKKEKGKKEGLKKIGGYKKIKDEIYYYILLPLIYKNIYDEFHIDINRGVLLHGPPGCGKTFIALAIKEELLLLKRKLFNLKLKNKMNDLIASKNDNTTIKECTTNEQKQEHNKRIQLGDKYMNDNIILPEMEILKSTDLIDNNNSGTKINELFLRCYKRYKEENKCSIIFIDEIEILCEKRENENINLYTSTLLNNMDGIKKNTHTILIGATNYINKMDLALRRSGRFDKDIEINIPNLKDRISIFKKKLDKINHNISQKQIKEISDMCQSYTCSDINALINVAMYMNLKGNNIISRKRFKRSLACYIPRHGDSIQEVGTSVVENEANARVEVVEYQSEQQKKDIIRTHDGNDEPEQMIPKCDATNEKPVSNFNAPDKSHLLKYTHLLKGLKYVKPSGMKELYVDIPKTRIKDIGGYKFVKRCIMECLIYPKKYKQVYEKYNIQSPKGILLYGPPGCSKTLFAKAIASEINMNFISVKGPEIFSKYVGESEKTIRNIFKKARENNPCVIFFDEIDSIAVNRNLNQNFVSNRVLCQLLNEIDGIYNRVDVIILAATNRPDLIDPALLRPGRFDRIIYVPLPNYKSRFSILKKTLKFYKINNMIHEKGKKYLPTNSCISNNNEEQICPSHGKKSLSKNNGNQSEVENNSDSYYTIKKGKNINKSLKYFPCNNSKEQISKELEKTRNDNYQMENEKHYNECNVDSYTPMCGKSGDVEEKLPDHSMYGKKGDDKAKLNVNYSPSRENSEHELNNSRNIRGNKKKEKNLNESNFIQLCEFLAKNTKRYSGAEIVNICREASICALRETLKKCKNEKQMIRGSFPTSSFVGLRKDHFVNVLKKIKPQTSDKLINFYKNYKEQKKR
ncbi:AAA family ATPase [Plasmodium gonderi]|uniref:AAA family ATPase n=1 Tax=Plasmodium gonderi TaxID=77519 RepID=A0A1Y1JKN9_PLAGO|nr:AAA family ATPase [Plasmodium gonderi]GAW83089.1 AAA family ATPase [Plasmodium gonderi]